MTSSDSSIDKAFQILRVFTDGRATLSLSDIQRGSGLPMTTTHRLLKRLAEVGALEVTPDHRYRIGFDLWALGARSPSYGELHRSAQPTLQSLYESTHLPVILTVLRGTTSVAVSRFVTERSPRTPNIGSTIPLHATSSGQVLLAHADEAVREQALAEPLTAYTSRTPTDPVRLREILTRVRYEGVALSDRELHDDLQSVAAPVYGLEGEVAAALSIVIPYAQAGRLDWVRLVQRNAGLISRSLARMHSIPPTYAAVRALVNGR